jgi:hypothetical protein
MKNSRRTPEDWHALGQFFTQMAFALCLVGVCAGVLYCLIFVTQPMGKQAPNDAVLFELLKTVAVSMISIIGTLMAVGHGSNATATPITPKPIVMPAPTTNWTDRQPTPPSTPPKPMARPLSTNDDEPVFKGAKE